MSHTEQESYTENLEALVTARTEQLRNALTCLQEIAADLETLKNRLASRGVLDELPAIDSLVKKARGGGQRAT